jgi:cell division protein FtsQ
MAKDQHSARRNPRDSGTRGYGARQNQSRTSSGSGSIMASAANHIARLMLVAVVVIVGYGGTLLYRQIDKPLTNVMIGGDFTFLQPTDLSALVARELDGGFLSVDLEHLTQMLRAHPWVAEVNVRREWPSILKVEVTEEVPIARWGEKGFLNRLGEELLIENNSHLSALPVLRADSGSSREMMEKYQLMAELLVPTGLKITELRRNHLGVWFIDTAPGVELVIGRDQVSDKIRRFNLVWGAGLNQQVKNIAAIDLRYPNGLAVSWRDTAVAARQQKSDDNRFDGKTDYNTRERALTPVQA